MANLFLLLFLACLALLILGIFKPAKSLFWYKKVPTKKKSFLIYLSLTILCFILFGVATDRTPNNSSDNTVTASKSGNAENIKNDDVPTSTEIDMKTKILNNIKSIEGGDDLIKNEMNSAQDFTITAAIFKAYAMTINEGKSSTDKEILNLTDELEKKVVQSQLKNFPKIRKAYYEFVKNTLWENDIDAYLSGSGNTVIKFTGAYFAANKNIKATQDALHEMLTLLRFKQTQYRWYKGQDDFTYYTIESFKDSEISD